VLAFAFVMVGWILSVMVHEFAHAATAWLGGDRTVVEKGYLSFDPRRYGDLGVSLVIPLVALAMGGIGFPGGAVYVRNDLIRTRLWRSATSLAGPAATLVILLVLAFGLSFWAGWGVSGEGPLALFAALTVLAFLQAMGLILNLLPIPGLDGFGAIRPFLPAGLAPHIRKAEGLVMIGLLLVIFWVPGASAVLFRAAATLSLQLGLSLDALQAGWRAFHFWQR
jgi:Zn-dependent protease